MLLREWFGDDIWSDPRASTKSSMSLPVLLFRDPRTTRGDVLHELKSFSTATAKGIKNENRLPSPTLDSTRSWPPNCSTIRATTANPRPRPGEAVRGAADSTCSNSRKIFSSLVGGIPQPVSATTISTAVEPSRLRPSGSSKGLHSTVILPWVEYFTGS